MKLKLPKALFAAILAACVSVGSAETTTEATPFSFDFNFDDPLLTDDAQWHSVSFITGGYRATITASGTGVLKGGDWATPATGDTAPDAISPDYDYIKGGNKSTSLTLTIGQLTASQAYDFTFSTGLPFEGTGNGNTISTQNTYTSATTDSSNQNSPVIGAQNVDVQKITNYTFNDIQADSNGKIAVTVNTEGYHSATFNAATLTGAGKGISGTNVYAADAATTGNIALIVSSGNNKGNYIGAFGNASGQNLNGNAAVKLTGEFGGTDTVFGAVNVGTVTGDVSLVFDAADATYGTFSETAKASVVGAYNASIQGKLSASINAGTFQYDIIGGVHTGTSGSIGSTQITINNGADIQANVYGGGRDGSVNGNTAVIINSLAPFSSHTESNVISAGGTGGSIGGNATLTFNGVNGLYAGIVQGEGNATVSGASKLVVSGDSALTLNTVQDFDAIEVQTGSALTINGAITTDATLQTVFDSSTVANRTANGLGNGIVIGLVSGDGALTVGSNATLNGKTISGYSNGGFVMEDAVYYVVGEPQADSSSERVDRNYRYVLTPNKSVMFTNVVNVGNHDYDDPISGSGPIPDAEANSALYFYLKEGTTLCISGDSKTSGLSAGAMLVNTAGAGDVIMRAPGYTGGGAAAWNCVVEGKTQATGGLYLAPKIMFGETVVDEQNMNFVLGKDADISSFNSVNVGTQHVEMVVNDKLGKNEQGHHINNLTLLGGSDFYMHINTDKNEELVLGGTTTVQTYVYFGDPGGNGHTGATLNMNFNQSATVSIECLESNREYNYNYNRFERLYIYTAYGAQYDHADTIDAVVNIDSFDYRGYITYTAQTGGSIHVNLTLQDGQWLESSQYASFAMKSESSASLVLKGTGRYVLEEGKDIRINFGRLSEEKSGDDYLWRGTVQLTNLDATSSSSGTGNGIDFAVHGNAQSVVDMNGFKGDVVEWGEDGTASANQPESIIIAPHLQLTNTDKMRAFEVTGGVASQTYAGGISGSGDFVVSSSGEHSITFSGDVSGWDGALKVTQGAHTVTMSGDATTVNADIAASGSGTLGLGTAADVTYNGSVQVSSLAVNSGKSATLTQGATAGNVSIAGKGGQAAVLSGGATNAMQVASGLVSGGKVAGAAISFNAAANDVLNTISNVELQNVSVSSAVANDTILLQGIRTGWTAGASVAANNVELLGSGITFRSVLGEGEQFTYQSTQAAAQVNHVALQTDAFAGTKLGSGAAVEVQVADAVNWGDLVNNLQTNVTIHLQGLYVDGMTIGEKIQASAMPDYVKILSVNGAAARSSMPGVAALLAQEFDSITYLQQADGFIISMTHAIPEPTTATLSLLALAALAARRRRR